MKVFRTETSPMTLIAFLLMYQVSAYDIDDSVLHKITFSPHGVHTNLGENPKINESVFEIEFPFTKG